MMYQNLSRLDLSQVKHVELNKIWIIFTLWAHPMNFSHPWTQSGDSTKVSMLTTVELALARTVSFLKVHLDQLLNSLGGEKIYRVH